MSALGEAAWTPLSIVFGIHAVVGTLAEAAATTVQKEHKKLFPSPAAVYLVMATATVLLIGDLVLLAGTYSGDAVRTAAIGYRWMHFVAGITWIGLLYFFNFVNVPYAKEQEFGSVKGVHIPKLLGRALFWFRWGAMLTILAGFGLLFTLYYPPLDATSGLGLLLTTASGNTILSGLVLGLVMWFNVWFIIWPNQKKIITATQKGEKPDPGWGKTALLASRANTVLSFPMLFFMAGSSHYPLSPVLLAGVFVVTALAAVGMVLLTAKS